MYPVIENAMLTMNDTKSASSQLRAIIGHTDLIQQKKPDDPGSRRISKKKVSTCCLEVKKSTEINNKDEKKTLEELTGSHDCQICGKVFHRKNDLKSHVIHHNPMVKKCRYQCIGCNERFKKEKEKQEHELQCERNYGQSRLECCFCDLPCDTPKELRTHENKHRPIRKTCICIDCKKAFDSVLLLKVHIQKDHKTDVKPDEKPETFVKEPISMTPEQHFIELGTNVPNQTHIPVRADETKEKPFMCWKCGSRYKYEKSKIKHELKYHATGEGAPTKLSPQTEEGADCQQMKSSQGSGQDGLISNVTCSVENDEADSTAQLINKVENMVQSDNNNIIPADDIKKENGCLLPVIDVSVDVPVTGDSTEKRPDRVKQTRRSSSIRQPVIKKKCIGCDTVFDGPKERDEHELNCGLNCFNRRFNCMFCDHPFVKPKALRKHENKHRPVKKTKKYKNRCVCIECNKTFEAIYSLRVHMKKLHRKGHVAPFENKPFACSVCDARFKYENSKYKHELRYHSAGFDQPVGYDIGKNWSILQNADSVPVVCKMEKDDPECREDVDIGCVKKEADDNLYTEDNLGCLTSDKVVYSIYNMKTEVDHVDSPLINPTVTGDEVAVKTEETDEASRPDNGRKRKSRKPVEKKPKKQKTGPFVCNNCEAKFNSPQGLWLHSYHQNMRTKRMSCIGCGKSFKGEKETEEHELRCNLNQNEYDFNCMFCDEPFETPKLLRNHELQHRPRRKTKNHKCVCIECRKPFDSIHSLKEHIREHHKKNNIKMENQEECTPPLKRRTLTMKEMMSCYVLLEDIDELRTEKESAMRNSSQSNSKITGATVKVATTADGRVEPETDSVVEGDVKCKVDVKEETSDVSGVREAGGVEDIKPEFSDDLIEAPAYLVETEMANLDGVVKGKGTGSFQCGKCSELFDTYGKLRYHSYSHRQRTKRLFCIGCGVGFEQCTDRDKHELECEVNLTNGRFSCIFCELPFETPQSLRNHENKHRPPKRYKRYKHMCLCAECDRAFDAVFTLKIHIRHMHRGSKGKVRVKEEVKDTNVNFESDLTFEEFKFEGDLKVERLN